ncbi:glycine cleavage system aminomethyltransferase GcvT [Haloimpatiens sp. FM7315]|uniref:glycine cleavage system aminomethyltransferase GcvT n=1 Tax=Haloimpatiens sp. FM7315 TaxID=3298609 RepID=UPI0035A2CA80
MCTNLKNTPLRSVYEKYGGKIIDFTGWALPVQFEGIIQEHERVRNKAGLFDVSHMGEVTVEGKDALKYLDHMMTNNIKALVDNEVVYTLMCYKDGGVVDDLILYRYSDDRFFLVVNASNVDKDYKWLVDNIGNFDVKLENVSSKYAQLAIQGPNAEKILQKIADTNLSEIEFFHFKDPVKVDEVKCIVSRTGYTGEDGFEIYLNPENAVKVWEKLMEVGKEEGLAPIGLGARDTLRFEATLPLYGNEISKDITPIEAGLGYFVKLDKEEFNGKEVLKKQKTEGLTRKEVGFEMKDRGVARHGYNVFDDNSNKIGVVTTGYYSPTLKKNIGIALVDINNSKMGSDLYIEVRNRKLKAEIVSKRFYVKKTKNK